MAAPPPTGGQTGATARSDRQTPSANIVRERLDAIIIRIDGRVGQGKEQIDAIEFLPVNLGSLGQVEHCIEIDRRLAVIALADEAGPHGVVQLGIRILGHLIVLPQFASRRTSHMDPGLQRFSSAAGTKCDVAAAIVNFWRGAKLRRDGQGEQR